MELLVSTLVGISIGKKDAYNQKIDIVKQINHERIAYYMMTVQSTRLF